MSPREETGPLTHRESQPVIRFESFIVSWSKGRKKPKVSSQGKRYEEKVKNVEVFCKIDESISL